MSLTGGAAVDAPLERDLAIRSDSIAVLRSVAAAGSLSRLLHAACRIETYTRRIRLALYQSCMSNSTRALPPQPSEGAPLDSKVR